MSKDKNTIKISYGAINVLWQLINLMPTKNFEISNKIQMVGEAILDKKEYFDEMNETYNRTYRENPTMENQKSIRELAKKLNETKTDIELDEKAVKFLGENLEAVLTEHAKDIKGVVFAKYINEIKSIIKE